MTHRVAGLGVVIIGRNEGERLARCLKSVLSQASHIVYVDSGSSDDSLAQARALGANVVLLDTATPFTAARARNAGMDLLQQLAPALEYVQFVDGDCEVRAGWLEQALVFLQTHPTVAAVCGRRRERYPERSLYNWMCDVEWNTPTGETRACGGDALMRVAAFRQVGGFRADLIAGEEPELCLRLRARQWKIWRLDAEMTWHDAAMLRFLQWWRRTKRGGYAFAEGAYLHGRPPERHWVAEARRAWIWAFFLPWLILFATLTIGGAGLLIGAGVYLAQMVRLGWHNRTQGLAHPWSLAGFMVLGKFAELSGQLAFHYRRLLGKTGRLIEYK